MFTEPALNVLLAELLTKRGLVAGGELLSRTGTELRKPDVVISIGGIRLVLEGKLDKPTAKKALDKDSPRRVSEGIADIAVGVVYKLAKPIGLVYSNIELKQILRDSKFEIRAWGPAGVGAVPLGGWVEEDIDGLARVIRSAVNEVTSLDILADAITNLRVTLDLAASQLADAGKETLESVAEKLAPTMQVPVPKNDDERLRTLKMAFLVLMDAAIFYNVIAPRYRLPALRALKKKTRGISSALTDAFLKALKINYEPVFDLSVSILSSLPAAAERSLGYLDKAAFQIASSRALLKHDLMGRIYHTLLFADIAKHLATYYTSVPAAWLLSRAAIDTPGATWDQIDWSDAEAISNLVCADFACGSGTLLSSTYHAIEDRHLDACAISETEPRPGTLHSLLIEHSL